MSAITHYQIKDYDTLEVIAARLLGDPNRWTEIVAANNLRYPFISNDPKYQYGVVLEQGTLGFSVPTGTVNLTLLLTASQLATSKGVLLLEQDGIQEALTLSKDGQLVDNLGNVQLTFTDPAVNSFDSYATWSLFSNPVLQTTKVAKTGDLLVLYNALVQDKADTTDQFTKYLGSDVSLDDGTRQLRWDSTTHDFELVSGVPNLEQALRLKVMTNQGDLLYHPKYGDLLLQFVGASSTPIFMNLASGLIRECLLQDPRLFAVKDIKVSVDGDVCRVDAQAVVRGLDTLVTLTSLGIDL